MCQGESGYSASYFYNIGILPPIRPFVNNYLQKLAHIVSVVQVAFCPCISTLGAWHLQLLLYVHLSAVQSISDLFSGGSSHLQLFEKLPDERSLKLPQAVASFSSAVSPSTLIAPRQHNFSLL